MSRFLRDLKRFHPLIHRAFLFFKPAYWRHRTPAQKRFDTRIQYVFIGCLLGVLLAAFIIPSLKTLIQIKEEQVLQTEVTQEQDEEALPQCQPGECAIDLETEPDTQQPLIEVQRENVVQSSFQLKNGEALSTLLKRAGLSIAEGLRVAQALDMLTEIRKLRPGQTFELFFAESGEFYGLIMETRSGDILSVFKDEDGDFMPKSREGRVQRQMVRAEGMIQTSFSEAAKEAEIPAGIVQQVTQALEEEVDFSTVQPDTPFEVIYERKMTETGREVGKKTLLYVGLATQKEILQRYYFVDAAGNQGFYNEYGESVAKTVAKRPLGRVRISSGFGMRRHPVLGYQIHHAGIDFVASIGTAIPAGADGVIVRMGRNGAYGKYVRIKHNDTYSTAYGHLSDFNSEFRVGSTVKKGDIIGYTGNTGRSTGPHLHYEVIKNDVQVSPLETHIIPKRTLKNKSLDGFIKRAKEINPAYQYPVRNY